MKKREKIKNLLGTESGLFSCAWAITNHITQKKFDSFLENHRKPSGRRMTRKQLRNDEIIFYREDQVTVKYLVELKR